jgi:ribosome assembly protein 4
MATLLPPPSKKAKLAQAESAQIDLSTITQNVLCQFRASDTGEVTGTTIRIPARTTAKELELLLNQLLQTVLPCSSFCLSFRFMDYFLGFL